MSHGVFVRVASVSEKKKGSGHLTMCLLGTEVRKRELVQAACQVASSQLLCGPWPRTLASAARVQEYRNINTSCTCSWSD